MRASNFVGAKIARRGPLSSCLNRPAYPVHHRTHNITTVSIMLQCELLEIAVLS